MKSFGLSPIRTMPARRHALGVRLIIVLVTSIALQNPNHVRAQLPSDEMLQILRIAMAENGYLTQDMHEQFWKTLRRTADNTEQEAFIKILAPALEWGQEYQLELWKSARLSYLEGQVNKTPSLVEMQNNVDGKFQEWISKAPEMPDYRKMIQDTKRGLDASMENGEVLLEAAAVHDPMPFPNAPSLRLDKEYIDRIIDRIDDSFSRVKNLLDPAWRD